VTRLAIATCATNQDVDTPVLLAACAAAGVEADMAVWDDPSVAWESYDATIVRSTWDYSPRRAEFLAWARARPRLFNPYDVLEYSSDKHYLLDLAAQGVAIVPSVFCEVGEIPTFPEGDFVVKPAVGAGAIGADRFRPHEHERARAHVAALHQAGQCALIQPYAHTVDFFGEHDMIFINGRYSHAIAKRALLNTAPEDRDAAFRRSQVARDVDEPEAIALAESVLTGRFANLLYARVDVVAAPSGWQVSELEMVEPCLFLTFHESAADALVAAVLERL
jgi:hypothetical protein